MLRAFFLFTHLLPIIHAPQVNKKKIISVWEEKITLEGLATKTRESRCLQSAEIRT